jgi:drug/metabolite transporter (DMT)-like permease
VPADAFLLAFAAAWIHGSSNVFLGRRRDPEAATAVMLLVGVTAFAPATALDWSVSASALPYIGASALLELLYFAFLAAAYRGSDVSLIYPVARGTAPVLVVVGTLVFLGRAPTLAEAIGVLTVGLGIVLVRGIRLTTATSDTRGFVLALATGIFIAGYTLVDKEGVQHAAPIPYIELVLLAPALIYAGCIARLRGLDALRRESSLRLGAVSVILFGTYVLVLFALRLAPAASVSAVRETSVVVATGVAAFVARERVGPLRFLGALLVAGGIALVALGS